MQPQTIGNFYRWLFLFSDHPETEIIELPEEYETPEEALRNRPEEALGMVHYFRIGAGFPEKKKGFIPVTKDTVGTHRGERRENKERLNPEEKRLVHMLYSVGTKNIKELAESYKVSTGLIKQALQEVEKSSGLSSDNKKLKQLPTQWITEEPKEG